MTDINKEISLIINRSWEDGTPFTAVIGGLNSITIGNDRGFSYQDIRRLVACWNALKGFDTETIEAKSFTITL